MSRRGCAVGIALVTAALAALAATAETAETAEGPAEAVIRGIAIVDIGTGRLLAGRDIVVRGTRIERIALTGGPLPAAKTRIDGRGEYTIAGLIDAP